MICSICGCEMKNNGDWFACPTCGSVHFGPDPDEDKSISAPSVKKEGPPVETPKEPAQKLRDLDEEILFFVNEHKEEPVKAVGFTDNKFPSAEPPALFDDSKSETVKDEPLIHTEPKKSEEPETYDEPEVLEKPEETEETVTETLENSEEDEENEEESSKKKSRLKDIVDFMLPIVAAIVIAFVLKTFIIANAKVPTSSMVATINVGDRIIASRLAYKADSPNRYDIVLFYYPDDESDIFVKRVLGLPGETLEVIDGIVYVTTQNGRTIQTEQSFVNPAEIPSGNYGPYYIPEQGEIITVDGNYCFAENGMIVGHKSFLDKYCVKNDRGKYVVAENLYFMMGDNRNQSHDSRGWDFPYVAENKIIGKVLFRYYPSFEKIE